MKTQIVLPDGLAEELKRVVPKRKRSRFIAAALDRELRGVRFRKTLKETAGCWTDRGHHNLHTLKDVERYVCALRGCEHAGIPHGTASH